jgi:hypothetical protein
LDSSDILTLIFYLRQRGVLSMPISLRAEMTLRIDWTTAQDADGSPRGDNPGRMTRQGAHLIARGPKSDDIHGRRLFLLRQLVRDENE